MWTNDDWLRLIVCIVCFAAVLLLFILIAA
jgi:hypothetical protein